MVNTDKFLKPRLPEKKRRIRKWGEKMSEQEKQIEKQNKKIEHWLWIIFVSMITSIITTILATM